MLPLLTFLSLNVNGLHNHNKWSKLWQHISHFYADVLALQELHITQNQEYGFHQSNASFDFYFSSGTSRSGGVILGIRQNGSIKVLSFKSLRPHGAFIDVQIGSIPLRIFSIYAPVHVTERKTFLVDLEGWIVPGESLVMGDFNTVCLPDDRLSS